MNILYDIYSLGRILLSITFTTLNVLQPSKLFFLHARYYRYYTSSIITIASCCLQGICMCLPRFSLILFVVLQSCHHLVPTNLWCLLWTFGFGQLRQPTFFWLMQSPTCALYTVTRTHKHTRTHTRTRTQLMSL